MWNQKSLPEEKLTLLIRKIRVFLQLKLLKLLINQKKGVKYEESCLKQEKTNFNTKNISMSIGNFYIVYD